MCGRLLFLGCFASGRRITGRLTYAASNITFVRIAWRGALHGIAAIRRNRFVVCRGGTRTSGFAFSFSRRVVLRHGASQGERRQSCCQ